MAKSKQRKNKKPSAGRPAPHALAAEAAGVSMGFEFRGHRFEIDLSTVDFGKAMFAMQVAQRGGNLSAQMALMVDALEAVLGVEQVGALYELATDLFSSEAAQREFWESFAAMSTGGSLGEPSAS